MPNKAPIRIDTVAARARLAVRPDPYWQRVRAGLYLGYRKGSAGTEGTWLVRFRSTERGQLWNPLGALDQFAAHERFDQALLAAQAWAQHLASGGAARSSTVLEVCSAYADKIRDDKGAGPALDLQNRYRRWVQSDPIASIVLGKLTRADVRAFRKRLVDTPVRLGKTGRTRIRSLVTVNRDIAAVRAAFNHALDERIVTSDFAWRQPLRAFKNVEQRRGLYLDREQRRALLAHAEPEFGRFIQALSLIPLRPGALAKLTVARFDARLGVLEIGNDKAGHPRRIKLPDPITTLFIQAAGGRDPDRPLFIRDCGLAWDKDSWKHPLKRAASAAGLPAETIAYTLRHCAITDMVHAGVDLLTVAQLSGTSVKMIEKHYGHLRDEISSNALTKLLL